ncbi:MAG: hypothetical protein CVV64_19865 [Candidatus Wallbacteria bacterium HGW-Wallbacteria-1]|jgi:cysteinyl-tRNA synthetase|uniref:Uncharacterized protein n=1 Tax=Candidatus Wallbacteria bacterium HGW-Wallbacteria-1 TaxID=2013854 RepID=A0A2N1PIK9_9BACT|nr:MAG: hypothetical protein CVV64_19865 [Candidatus Wallbacteria bacterium HGW-Wallbacteria-1]
MKIYASTLKVPENRFLHAGYMSCTVTKMSNSFGTMVSVLFVTGIAAFVFRNTNLSRWIWVIGFLIIGFIIMGL